MTTTLIGQTYVQPETLWGFHSIPRSQWDIKDTIENGQVLGLLEWISTPVDTYKALITKGYSKEVAYVAFKTKAFHANRLKYDLFTQYHSHIRLASYKEFM